MLVDKVDLYRALSQMSHLMYIATAGGLAKTRKEDVRMDNHTSEWSC